MILRAISSLIATRDSLTFTITFPFRLETIVTHEMAFARDVANRVIFMDGGVIVEQGPARDVIENPQAERTKQFLARYRENQ